MDLWISVLIVLVALATDAVIGDPPNRIHPLRWMGNLAGWLDRHIRRKNPKGTKIKGFLSYLMVAGLFIFTAFFILALVREYLGEIVWIIVSGLMLKLTFAVFSFRRHCRPIQKDLESGDLKAAADKTQMIVSRNTEGMDEAHLASSCVETVSENFADSVCSPGFYFGILGMFGGMIFRTANMMDAMWGYRDRKYCDLGYFPAKFDDVLGFITSRISVIFIMFAAFLMKLDARSAWYVAKHENRKTPSPNSGWPMAAVAGALGIKMVKEGVYEIGKGPMPSSDDISKSYKLIELASIIFMVAVTIPLYSIIGVHVQMFMEDMMLRLLEVLTSWI